MKDNFGGERFNIDGFWTNEAAFLTVMLTYNLMSLFRQIVLGSDALSGKPDVQLTFKTLRYKLFAKAGYITKDSCKRSLIWPLLHGNVNGLMGCGIGLNLLLFP